MVGRVDLESQGTNVIRGFLFFDLMDKLFSHCKYDYMQ